VIQLLLVLNAYLQFTSGRISLSGESEHRTSVMGTATELILSLIPAEGHEGERVSIDGVLHVKDTSVSSSDGTNVLPPTIVVGKVDKELHTSLETVSHLVALNTIDLK
jgi:hypothetical protein